MDPMNRDPGALTILTVLDLENRKVVECDWRAMLFRRYEAICRALIPAPSSTSPPGPAAFVGACIRR